jgi:glycosyltransferase involved in cell wall biosynthesis
MNATDLGKPVSETAASRGMAGHAPATHRISIVATVRNESATVAPFVDSLLAQTLTPDEVIIVDGASTDGTTEILRNYEARRAIVLISQDCNIAQGRNLGIRRARHELIAVTDAGCVVDPDWLRQIWLCFQSDEKPDVVAGNFRFDCRTPFEEAVTLATFSPDRETSPRAGRSPSSRSVGFRKSVWAAAKGYPEWLYAAEDALLNIRFHQLGFRFKFCRDAVVTWRPRSTWRALAKQRINFARGNGRVGIGTQGYAVNLKYHLAMLAPLIGGAIWPWLLPITLIPIYAHAQRNLWTQAGKAARISGKSGMRWRILLVMEFVRLAGLCGFFLGRWDRLRDPSFAANQMDWMGVSSLDELADPVARRPDPLARNR